MAMYNGSWIAQKAPDQLETPVWKRQSRAHPDSLSLVGLDKQERKKHLVYIFLASYSKTHNNYGVSNWIMKSKTSYNGLCKKSEYFKPYLPDSAIQIKQRKSISAFTSKTLCHAWVITGWLDSHLLFLFFV